MAPIWFRHEQGFAEDHPYYPSWVQDEEETELLRQELASEKEDRGEVADGVVYGH